LNGHLDTVPVSDAAWRFPPFEAAIHGGRLYGRGASDMKAGLAAMVAAAVAIRRAGVALAGDLVFAATVDEEVACRGARALVARGLGPFQGVVIGEPSDLDVYVAEKGALWLEATLRGVAAHGAYPHLGRNAINAMARAVTALEGIELPQTLHPLLGGMTLNVGTIQGGTKTNIVADRCTVTLDIRTVPGQSHAEIVRAVERVLATTGLETEVRVVSDYPPIETPPDAELVQALVAEASAARGEPARVTGAFYFTDGAVFAPAWQVPVAICGPGAPETAHKPDEWVDLERVHQAARVYARTALRLLA
jgi:succinyl-diaminopimelate desuccinylase